MGKYCVLAKGGLLYVVLPCAFLGLRVLLDLSLIDILHLLYACV